jgi:hypothetical protein
MRLTFKHALFSIVVAILVTTADFSIQKMNQTKQTGVPVGQFGGTGIAITVEKSGAKIEYDCAEGEIRTPLRVDKKGFFKADGFHKGPNFGPTRIDDPRTPDAVRYEGQIVGSVMKFKVTKIKTGEVIGEFIVKRGQQPVMHRCA